MSNGKTTGEPSTEATETLLSHLIELRDRILRMFLAILVVFLMLFPFANQIYTFLATPLMVHLPEGTSMIAIEVAAPFLIPFKLVLLLGGGADHPVHPIPALGLHRTRPVQAREEDGRAAGGIVHHPLLPRHGLRVFRGVSR
jgi:hypothetical protein